MYALSILDGWDQENQRTARICATVHNGLMLNAGLRGSKVPAALYRDEQTYVPKVKGQEEQGHQEIVFQPWSEIKRNLGWE